MAETNSKRKRQGSLKRKVYAQELKRLQSELCKLQDWIKHKGLRVILVFEAMMPSARAEHVITCRPSNCAQTLK